jgi:hypothetical protein
MATKKLEMDFKTENGKKVRISVDHAKEDLNKDTVQAAMQTIIDADIFEPSNGKLVGIESAQVVTTDVDELIIG